MSEYQAKADLISGQIVATASFYTGNENYQIPSEWMAKIINERGVAITVAESQLKSRAFLIKTGYEFENGFDAIMFAITLAQLTSTSEDEIAYAKETTKNWIEIGEAVFDAAQAAIAEAKKQTGAE